MADDDIIKGADEEEEDGEEGANKKKRVGGEALSDGVLDAFEETAPGDVKDDLEEDEVVAGDDDEDDFELDSGDYRIPDGY